MRACMNARASSAGVKESDTGLSQPSQWDLVADKAMMAVCASVRSCPCVLSHLISRRGGGCAAAAQEEQPLLVARCTKIIDAGTDHAKYMITMKQARGGARTHARTHARGVRRTDVRVSDGMAAAAGAQIAKYVVELGDRVAPTDIEESMRVGVDRQKHKIQVCACVRVRVRTGVCACLQVLRVREWGSCVFCLWCEWV